MSRHRTGSAGGRQTEQQLLLPPTHPLTQPQVVATAQALLANGGVMAPVGTHIVAMAATRHSVPFVVLCGIYKLSTLFPHNPCAWDGGAAWEAWQAGLSGTHAGCFPLTLTWHRLSIFPPLSKPHCMFQQLSTLRSQPTSPAADLALPADLALYPLPPPSFPKPQQLSTSTTSRTLLTSCPWAARQ